VGDELRRLPKTQQLKGKVMMENTTTENAAQSPLAPCPGSAPGLYMRYFVLKPKGNDAYAIASRRAMREYARSIEATNPQLTKELREWADSEWIETPGAQEAGEALVRYAQRRG
jgi:hypothetical protein